MTQPTDRPAAALALAAPAKVNLSLRVLGRRADGMHELDAPTVPIDLCDEVIAQPDLSGAIASRLEPGPTPAGELAASAALQLQRAARVRCGVRLLVRKRIPAGAGLGGGSSDAAAALLLCNELWGLRWPLERLEDLAARVGADVAFFVRCRQARLTGAGAALRPLAQAARGCCVLLLAPFACSTAAVFARYASLSGKIRRRGRVCNDLLPAALAEAPALGMILRQAAAVAGEARLTGSGSCVFALARDRSEARDWAGQLDGAAGCRAAVAAILRTRPRSRIGEWPSGKAADFGSVIRRFESCLPSPTPA